MRMRRRLACCSRDRETSIDFDQRDNSRTMTYEGLESCILMSTSYTNESTTTRDYDDENSLKDDASSDIFRSHDTQITTKDDPKPEQAYNVEFLDLGDMKQHFAKLLLGEDVTGGSKGVSSALALSNAITNLAASIFGELWRLEPLAMESKSRWRKEVEWLLSPASFMVELVPAKQNAANGRVFEIMTTRARADVHTNLPALRKLDSMLIETLDSMVKTEFWYAEGSNHKEGCVRESKRWWLPYPRVPLHGLSENARAALINRGNVVRQVFKAAKSINRGVLAEMPVPSAITATLPKSGRASLGDELYNTVAEGSNSASMMADSLVLNSDHEALNIINKLEAARVAWTVGARESNEGKSPTRKLWLYSKVTPSRVEETEALMFRSEILMQELRLRHPNLPHTFLDATKIQYGKDVGHAIMEAYSRALASLAYNILMRIRDILQEDRTSNPMCLVPMTCLSGTLSPNWAVLETSPCVNHRARNSQDYFSDLNPSRRSSDIEISSSEARTSSVATTPSVSRIWCLGSDGFGHCSPCKTP